MGLIGALFPSNGSGGLVPLFELLATVVSKVIQAVLPLVVGLVQTLAPALTAIINIITNVIKIFMGVINIVIEFIKVLFTGKWDEFGKKVQKIFSDIWKSIVYFFVDLANLIVATLNTLIFSFFNGLGGGIADVIKGLTGGKVDLKKPNVIPKIPYPKLAEGGIIQASPGGTMAMIGEAGRPERVEPLDPSGLSKRDYAMIELLTKKNGGGAQPITVNVYPSAGMDERELAEKVSRQLQLMMRRGATA
jgi:hypothetical protein